MPEAPKTPRDIGSFSGMTEMPKATWTFRDAGGNGQLMRVEDYGPGRVWVQNLESPTGMGWWASREEVIAASRPAS